MVGRIFCISFFYHRQQKNYNKYGSAVAVVAHSQTASDCFSSLLVECRVINDKNSKVSPLQGILTFLNGTSNSKLFPCELKILLHTCPLIGEFSVDDTERYNDITKTLNTVLTS